MDGWAASLPPGAFSFVMATGIVATAATLLGVAWLAWALLAVNVAAYAALALLLVLRVARYGPLVLGDLRTHGRAPGLLTTVAGTCVLATQFIVLARRPAVAAALGLLGLLLWAGLIYAFFALMTVQREKPPLEQGINGTWMLTVVSTQAVSVVGSLLSPFAGEAHAPLLALALCLFLLGGMFYLLLFSLILYRFLFFSFDPELLSPPYWINMGAVAITTLAGSLLMLHTAQWPFLTEILPFLKGITLMFWATATWWIPLLLLLGAWRHLYRRIPLRYDLQFWSMVFPLGMYTVATFRLAEALRWPFLLPLPRAFGYAAILAWALAFLGLARSLARRPPRPAPARQRSRSLREDGPPIN